MKVQYTKKWENEIWKITEYKLLTQTIYCVNTNQPKQTKLKKEVKVGPIFFIRKISPINQVNTNYVNNQYNG